MDPKTNLFSQLGATNFETKKKNSRESLHELKIQLLSGLQAQERDKSPENVLANSTKSGGIPFTIIFRLISSLQ